MDRPNGKATWWYKNGNIQHDFYYVHGKREGTWVSNDLDGMKVSETQYSEGEKHGQEIEYNPDGSIRKSNNYYMGEIK